MRARRLTRIGPVALGVLVGGLVFATAPALAAAPEVLSEGVSSVTPYEAHLEAMVNAGDETMECRFEYGETSVAEHKAGCEQGNALEGGEQGVGKTVTGLEPGKTYRYRVVVKNATSELEGPEEHFATPPLEKPTVASESVPYTTPYEARVEGAVNPDYQLTTCVIDYGETTSYGEEVPCEPSEELEGGEQGIGATITGLTPDETYYYRILATNGTGEAEGAGELTTLPLEKPHVEGENSSSVTSSSATLEAPVNPEYQETTCEFQYGTEESLKTSTTVSCEQEPIGSGGGAVGASAKVSGLSLDTTYYYRVVAKNMTGEAEGAITPFTTLGTAPLVSTGAVSMIGQSSANVTGTVTPEGAETHYYYQYGPSTEYGQRTASAEAGVDVGTGLSSVAAPATLVPLTPGVTYHYRLVAWNEYGTTYGQDATFTTEAGRSPRAVTGPASGISVGEATLSGTINPQGAETSYRFEYGTSVEYGTKAFGTVLPEQGEQTVTLSLRGLQAGTTYHYRLVVTNPGGTSVGQDETFTTPPISDPLVNPTVPPLIATPNIAFPKEEKASGTTTKTLTNAEKLKKALKACKKEKKKKKKSKRVACEKRAKKKYPTTKAK